MAGRSNPVPLCGCCSHLVMNKCCWLFWGSQKGVIGLLEMWPENTKPAHPSCWSRALPLANHVSDVVGGKNLPFSSRTCVSYTLNYPMMTLQMQHMPLWPQGPTTVISSAFHQSSSASSRHSVPGYSCSLMTRVPALRPLLQIRKRLSGRKLTPLVMQNWVHLPD